MSIKRKVIVACISVVTLCAALIVTCYLVVSTNASGRTFDEVKEIPHNRVGLLLATSPITPEGTHNFYFDNRIKAADELFKAGKIDFIIASGGDYTQTQKNGCDEPKAILDSLVARGVPEDNIILDYEGTRTLNSIAKAKNVYGLDSVTMISQKYHNERAIYLADNYGIHAVGYNAEPSPILRSHIKNTIREYLARVKMFIDFINGGTPHFESKQDEIDSILHADANIQVKLLKLIDNNPSVTLQALSSELGITVDQIRYQRKQLENKGVYLCRKGATKKGTREMNIVTSPDIKDIQ